MSAIWDLIAEHIDDDFYEQPKEIPILDTTDETVRALRAAGWTDDEIAEIVDTLKGT